MMNFSKVYYCTEYDFESERFLELLPTKRQDKYKRLRFEKDKQNCVGAYLLLLRGLEEIGIDQWKLEYTSTGKPYIKNNPVYFNISHGKNGFACAVSKSEVGIDIQEFVAPKETMLKKICSDNEKKTVADNPVRFTRLWTQKESIIKRYGSTIADYGKYEFALEENDFYAYGNHFVSLVEDDYVITVCGEVEKTEFIKVKSAEL